MIDKAQLESHLEGLKIQQKQAEVNWQKAQGAIEYSESMIKELDEKESNNGSVKESKKVKETK